MIRVFKKFADLLDIPRPVPGKFFRRKPSDDGFEWEDPPCVATDPDTGKRYLVGITIDAETGQPVFTLTEKP